MIPHASGQLSHVPQLLTSACPRACVLQQERPRQWDVLAPQLEKDHVQQWRSSTAKINQLLKKKKKKRPLWIILQTSCKRLPLPCCSISIPSPGEQKSPDAICFSGDSYLSKWVKESKKINKLAWLPQRDNYLGFKFLVSTSWGGGTPLTGRDYITHPGSCLKRILLGKENSPIH